MRRPLIIGGILAAIAGLWLAARNGRDAIDLPPGLPEAPAAVSPDQVPDHRIAHNGVFAALGRGTYRSRRWLPFVGLALVIGLNVWSATAGGRLSQGGWQVPGSEAERAEALFADRFGEQATSLIVILTDPDGAADSDEFQATVAESVAPLGDNPVVSEILTYADVGDPSFLSRDGTKTFALVRLDEDLEGAIDDAEHLASLVDAPAGVETVVTGTPLVQHEFNETVERDLVQAELISLPIAMLILLAVFGTLVGALLPIVIAAVALPSSMAVIGLLANVTEMSIFVTNVATMIGLALSIDYSLFTVSRFREELRHRSVADAVEHTMATVGKAVAISGVAVAIGLSSLMVFESPALRSMGIGGVVTVLSTLAFGLTVLPALLGMLGPRVNRLR
ncbi:MAG: MMPL family transporter, partial [Candidatus Limnocylindria bacterium]